MAERNYALAVGKIYTNRNDKDYLCKGLREPGCYIMERTTDGWTLEAHIITMYEDGTIEWDYSTGGHWTKRFEVWKDCELGGTYLVKSFDNFQEAYEWMENNERYFAGWHLRIVEK